MPEKLFHLGFDPNLYKADYAIIPGAPERVLEIASFLDDYKEIAYHREFKTVLGHIDNKAVFVCSTGIGGPSCAIAVEELYKAGVKNFIRVGTCGGINKNVKANDIIIATSSVRQEGTALHYAPIEFPATADYNIVSALVNKAKQHNINYHTGIIQCKDSFYGQHHPELMPVRDELLFKWNAWKQLGVLASEMESATLFTVASYLGVKAGTVLSVVWNQEKEKHDTNKEIVYNTQLASQIAVEAIKELKV